MLGSELEAVRLEGAAQACLASLSVEPARPLARKCLAGGTELRLGAARVFSQNLMGARFRAGCEAGLETLFEDEDAAVRKEAAEAIQHLEPDQVSSVAGLLERFLRTPAFEENAEMLLYALEDARSVPFELSLNACNRVIDMLASPIGIKRRESAAAREVSEVLLRAYVDAPAAEQRGRALDVIDRALAHNAHGAQRVLEEHDRA